MGENRAAQLCREPVPAAPQPGMAGFGEGQLPAHGGTVGPARGERGVSLELLVSTQSTLLPALAPST